MEVEIKVPRKKSPRLHTDVTDVVIKGSRLAVVEAVEDSDEGVVTTYNEGEWRTITVDSK